MAEARRRAEAAADLLGQKLKAELTAAMQKGGAEEAVRVCSQIGQSATREVGGEAGVALRRTSLKYRNVANAPDEFERAWLEGAEESMKGGAAPGPAYQVFEAADGRRELRYLRPIIFPGGVCSHCHGSADEIPPDVKALLRERYPADRATDFKPGDLRGAISVRVPVGAGETPPPRGK